MSWCIAIIALLTIVAVTWNEPGRFRGCVSVGEPVQLPPEGPRLELQVHRFGQRVVWTVEYRRGDGHRHLFKFGPSDYHRLMRELVAIQCDPEIAWDQEDTTRLRKYLKLAFLRFIASETNDVTVTAEDQ